MASVDVVISGIGGRFPRANNIEELSERLLEGKSLQQPAQLWNPGAKGTPKKIASTLNCQKFDNTFFGMHSVLSLMTDPAARIAVEIAFEAIIDAGINPSSLRGSNVQVYAGITQFECDVAYDGLVNSTGYAIVGRNRCMVANRISYFFNFTGRSNAYDGSGGWAAEGLYLARRAIQSGECDTVIVLGSTFAGFLTIHKIKQMFGLLSPDSELRPFSDKVNGYGRGEAHVAFLVQRADIAKRSYGSIVLAASETQGILPNWFLSVNEDHFRHFVSSLYQKNNVDVSKVRILEADGLCNKDMVETELKVLDEIFNEGRPTNNPLYLGSVKTICGESEGSGGLVSLTKLILALETGIISPTIHSGRLNPNIQGLTDGRFQLVTKPTKLEVTPDTVVAVSSLSLSGIVGHLALKANGKAKTANIVKDYPLPYLVLISGRKEGTVKKSLKQVTSSPFDPEYLRLTQEVFSLTIDRYEWRGFGFHGETNPEKFFVQRENRRPVWFVYSGMGSQWNECGKDLLSVPVFRDTMQRLHDILKPKNVDLMNIVSTTDVSVFDNILNSFVCITAIQISLTNLLYELGIKPDGIIGHSVGEIGCSYADGCLTEEETILASYARGVASLEAELIPGLMAAVGIGGDVAQKLLPPEVVVACRNSKDSCTISGPTEDVENVIRDLKKKGIFVRKVNVSNIAYHSPYIKPAAPYLLRHLQEVISTPKLRSSKWICTSAPEEKWDSDEVRYCSAEYQTNNLLSTVYFEEGAAHIPANALAIEVAPHGLLQAILKRSLGEEVAHVPLARRDARSPSKFLLKAIGKLFLEGLSPKIWRLYPDVSMPVSRSTPSLIPLIAWSCEDFALIQRISSPLDEINCEVNQFSPAIEVFGTNFLSPAYILISTWKLFVNKMRLDMEACGVVFDGVQFHDLVELDDKARELVSTTMRGGGFETYINDKVVANGKIRLLNYMNVEPLKHPNQQDNPTLCLHSDDVYAEMSNRGLGIREKMRAIRKLEIYPQDWIADVEVDDRDWTLLLNSLLNLFELRNCEETQSPASLNHIRRLVINCPEMSTRGVARLHLPTSTLLFPGIEIHQASFESIERPIRRLEISSHQFIPYGKTVLQCQESFLIHIIVLCLEKSRLQRPVFTILDFNNKNSFLAQKLQVILSSQFALNSTITTDWQDVSLILCEPASVSSVSTVVATKNVLVLSELNEIKQNAFEESLEEHSLRIIAEYDEGGISKRLVASSSTLSPLELSHSKVIKMGPEDEIAQRAIYLCEQLFIFVWEEGWMKSPNKIFSEISNLEGAKNIRKEIWDYSGEEVSNGRGRVMGVAFFDNASASYIPDSSLVWPVPDRWTLEEAATVPCAYSFAFFTLFEVAKLKSKESVFVTCPLTPIGQAALHIAFSLDCYVYVLLESIKEKHRLVKTFKNLSDEKIIISRTESFELYLKRALPNKVHVVLSHLSGSRLRACATCLGNGSRMVQINPEPMLARDYMGLQVFIHKVSVFGRNAYSLSRASTESKKRVTEWVRKGLNSGVVKPNCFRRVFPGNKMQDALKLKESDDVTKRVVSLLDEHTECKSKINFVVNKTTNVIIGGSKTQWLKLAYCLARKGSKYIVVAPEQSSLGIFKRHVQILQREYETTLKCETIAKNGADFVKKVAKSGPIQAIFIFEHSKASEDVVEEIRTKKRTDVQLVFISKESTFFTRMIDQWNQEGFKVKSAIGVDNSPHDKVIPLLDWLLSPASATVNDLSGRGYAVRKPTFSSFGDERPLPDSMAELAELGASIRGKTVPVFKEIVTRSTRAKVTHEIKPLFVLKGIRGQDSLDFESIATEVYAPMFLVTLQSLANNLEKTARAVVQGIRNIQKNGPYNVAGDPIRTDLTLRVARILEDEGFASVVFLMDERIKDMREELLTLEIGNRLSTSILEFCLSNDRSSQKGWKNIGWLSWEEQLSTVLSRIPFVNEEQRENVAIALEHIKVSMQHLVEAQEETTLKHGVIRSIRRGDEFREYGMGERRHVHIVPSSEICNKIAEIFSANLATPVMQLDLDRARGGAGLKEY